MGVVAPEVALDISRHHPRFAVRGWSVWIEWQDGDGGWGASAELINISLGGAMTLAPVLPRVGQDIALYLEGPEPPAWITAVVVGTEPGRRRHQVHFEFCAPCPVAMLEAVIGDQAS